MSNIYDKSSLVLIPSGTKTGKIFSQKPVSGDGDFTFTRASAATRVNADGNIEKERTNHITYSEDFTQWGLLGSSTLTTGLTDPNGGSTAVKVSNIGAGTGNYVDGIRLTAMPVTISAGSVVCQSIYMKGSGTILIGIERAISGSYFFNTQGFTLTSEWQRFDFFNLISTAAGGINFYVTNTTSTTATSVDIAFAQFEFGTAPTAYIPTNGSAVTTGITDNTPRLDYTDSSCPALLLEPSRTNMLFHSEYISAGVTWSTNGGMLTESNSVASPENLVNATKMTRPNGTGNAWLTNFLGGVVGQNQVLSVYAKAGTATIFNITYYDATAGDLFFNYDLSAGSVNAPTGSAYYVDSSIEDVGDGWYRCIAIVETANSGLYQIAIGNNRSGAANEYLYVYGTQWESNASYATSYIPTYGSSVSRVKDYIQNTSASSIIGQEQGCFYIEAKAVDSTAALWFGLGQGTNNRILIGSSGQYVRTYISVAGDSHSYTSTILTNTTYKALVNYNTNTGNFDLYVNGSKLITITKGQFNITLDSIISGNLVNENQDYEGTLNQMLIFPTALTDAECIALTTI
jgi:hypothetical protein